MSYKIILVFVIATMLLFGCAGFGGQVQPIKNDSTSAPTPQPTPTPPSSDDDYPPALPDE